MIPGSFLEFWLHIVFSLLICRQCIFYQLCDRPSVDSGFLINFVTDDLTWVVNWSMDFLHEMNALTARNPNGSSSGRGITLHYKGASLELGLSLILFRLNYNLKNSIPIENSWILLVLLIVIFPFVWQMEPSFKISSKAPFRNCPTDSTKGPLPRLLRTMKAQFLIALSNIAVPILVVAHLLLSTPTSATTWTSVKRDIRGNRAPGRSERTLCHPRLPRRLGFFGT